MQGRRKAMRDRSLRFTMIFIGIIWILSAMLVFVSKMEKEEVDEFTEPSVIIVEELPPIRVENK